MDTQSILLSNLEPGKRWTVRQETIDTKPNFTMIGNPMKSLDLIANFSKPEAFTFIQLKDSRDYETNYVRYSTSNLSNTDKVVFSKGYKALAEKNIVVRVSKGVTSSYMFNPDFIIPKHYKEAIVEWEKHTK